MNFDLLSGAVISYINMKSVSVSRWEIYYEIFDPDFCLKFHVVFMIH